MEERGAGRVSRVSCPGAVPRPSELFPVGFHGNARTCPPWPFLCLTPSSSVLSGAWVLHEGSPEGWRVPQSSPDPCLLQKPPSILIMSRFSIQALLGARCPNAWLGSASPHRSQHPAPPRVPQFPQTRPFCR